MRRRGRQLVYLIVASVGWCLLVACSGCVYPTLAQRAISREDHPLRLDRSLRAEGPAGGQQGQSKRGKAPAAESQKGPDLAEEDRQHPTAPEPPTLPDAGGGGSCAPVECAAPEASRLGLWCRVRGICEGVGVSLWGRLSRSQYRYPRFYPVPLQPVFLRRADDAPAAGMASPSLAPGRRLKVGRGAMPGGTGGPATAPGEGSPQIGIPSPAPSPEEIPPPKAEPQRQDGDSQAPKELQPAVGAESWLFYPPAGTDGHGSEPLVGAVGRPLP
jgi:hypothetical protein